MCLLFGSGGICVIFMVKNTEKSKSTGKTWGKYREFDLYQSDKLVFVIHVSQRTQE